MLFDSLIFLGSAALFLLLWPLAARQDATRWLLLAAASLGFLAWCDLRLAGVALLCAAVAYAGALGMARRPRLAAPILAATLLVYLLAYLYRPYPPALPLGMLVFVLQLAAYSVAVYRGRLGPAARPLHFLAYALYFPAALTGPLASPGSLLAAIAAPGRPDEAGRWTAARQLILGYFLVAAVAANMGVSISDALNASAFQASWSYWWGVAVLVALQMYAVFHGYSLIARGFSGWLGIPLPANFAHPFAAPSLSAFLRRWNRTLVAWFRLHVVLPLAALLPGAPPAAAAWIFAAGLPLFGLLHGRGANFALWGLALGAFLAVERLTGWPRRLAALPGGKLAGALLVTGFFVVASLLFRIDDLPRVARIVRTLFDPSADAINHGFWWAVFKSSPFLLWMGAYEVLSVLARAPFARPVLASAPWRTVEPAFWAALLAGAIYLRGPGPDLAALRWSIIG